MKAFLFWNFFIRLFIETYLDQAMTQSLKINALRWNPWTEFVASSLAIFIMATLVIFPVATWIILLKFKAKLEEKPIESKWGAVYENIRTSSSSALGYTSIFMLKRLAFSQFVFLIENHRVL